MVFARSLLRKLGGHNEKERKELLAKLGFADGKSLKALSKRESAVLDVFRVIDMYEAAIRYDLQVYRDRTGNWVQKFSAKEDANLFVTAHFSRYNEVEQFWTTTFARRPYCRPGLPRRRSHERGGNYPEIAPPGRIGTGCFRQPERSGAGGSDVCALLNGLGGTVLVGVDHAGKVTATADEAQAVRFREYLHQNIAPVALLTVNVDPTPADPILTVDVPAGSERPYVFDGTVFVRQGRQTIKADAELMRRLVEGRESQPPRWNAASRWGWNWPTWTGI